MHDRLESQAHLVGLYAEMTTPQLCTELRRTAHEWGTDSKDGNTADLHLYTDRHAAFKQVADDRYSR
jgi:hypothetical protein